MSGGEERDEGKRRASTSRYSLFVGLAFLVLVAVATVNTLRNRDDGILGTSGTKEGAPLAEFAVPDLRGSATGDANVYQDDCSTSANPCPAGDSHPAACRIRTPGALRVCDFFDRPLVLSFWFMAGADCLPSQDVIDRVARRFRGRVNFLSIDVRDDRDQARSVVEDRGWRIPVGYDADGAVSNLYRVGVCPTVAFAYPGGILSEARIGTGEVTEPKLTADVRRLLARSRKRAEEPR
jgi:hypothetical protein